MASHEQAGTDFSRNEQILDSVDAISQLLALNGAIELARADITQPFNLYANRVAERANPDAAADRNTMRALARPSMLSVALSHATASLCSAQTHSDPDLSEQSA